MPTQVDFSERMEQKTKRLERKYPSVVSEVRKLVIELEGNTRPGDRLTGLGDYEVYKVRLPNLSAKRGKSGGFRVLYYVQVEDYIYLLTIYSKTEQEDVSLEEVRQLIDEIQASDDENP